MNFIGNYRLLCRLKAWFSVLGENYSKLSHHLWYSCGLFRGIAQLFSIKLLYQTDLCTIWRVCSPDKIEKNYIMPHSLLFLPKMLVSLIYCCPGRQVCWIHVCITFEMYILYNTLTNCFHSTMPSSSSTNQKCKSVGCNPLRKLAQSSGLRYNQTAFLEHAKPIGSRHFPTR